MNTIVKSIVTVAVLSSALFVSAADRNPRSVSEGLIRQAQRTLELINREADYMTLRQIEMVRDRLDEINRIVRGGGNPYPGQPNPPTYQPPVPSVVNVRGSIENVDFNFDVRDLQGLHQQCVTFVNSRGLTQVDDMKVYINYGQLQTLRNNESWWKGANQICMVIVDRARREGVAASYDGSVIAIGSIENSDFVFKGLSKPDLFRQCESHVNSRGLTQVDEIVVSVNFNQSRSLKNSQSWWRGAVEICSQTLQDVR